MVNRKLSTEDEENIYYEWLAGKPLAVISEKYPVVVSTVQRVVKKKIKQDGLKRNFMMSHLFKQIKSAGEPLDVALKIFNDNESSTIHSKQKELLFESLTKLSNNIDILIEKIKKIQDHHSNIDDNNDED